MLMHSEVHPTLALEGDTAICAFARYRVVRVSDFLLELCGATLDLREHDAQVSRFVDIAPGERWLCETNHRRAAMRILATDLDGPWPIAAVDVAGGATVHQFDLDGKSKFGPRQLVGRADLVEAADDEAPLASVGA